MRDRGYALVLVTSQQGVGKGAMSQEDLNDIHQRMQKELAARGVAFDSIEAGTCECRKPSPLMMRHAALQLGIDPSASWMIGDHDRDIDMAVRADVPNTIRVLSHHQPGVAATPIVERTTELPALLRRVL